MQIFEQLDSVETIAGVQITDADAAPESKETETKQPAQKKHAPSKKAPPKKAPPKTTKQLLIGLLVKIAVTAALV